MRLMPLSTKLLDQMTTQTRTGWGPGDRAGELRECVQGPSPCLTFTTLITPPPRVVSPLDLWSCVYSYERASWKTLKNDCSGTRS